MPVFGDHPFTSITIKINQLSNPLRDDEDENGGSIELYIDELIELVKVQPSSGPVEAARAIRKKIKYGETVTVQLRALIILELMVLNSGPKIGPIIARDEKLLNVLKGIINGSGSPGSGGDYDRRVREKTQALAIGWKDELDGLDSYKSMQCLYKAIPKMKSRRRTFSRSADVRDVFESESDNVVSSRNTPKQLSRRPPPRPKTASPYSTSFENMPKNKSKKKKKRTRRRNRYADDTFAIPQINYKVEAPKIRELIANCQTHTSALRNILLTLPTDVSPFDDKKASNEFNKCRSIRRKVLRYLQFVGAGDQSTKLSDVQAMDEEFLGALIDSNDRLVEVFKRWDTSCGYNDDNPAPSYDDDDDDDSDYESYYSSEDSDEDLQEEELSITNSVGDRLQNLTLDRDLNLPNLPPPRPQKPETLGTAAAFKPLEKINTGESTSSDPFGDTNVAYSRYL